MLKLVKAWMTEDGEIFKSHSEAGEHKICTRKTKAIDEFVEEHCFSGMAKRDIKVFLLDQFDNLLERIYPEL